MTSVNGKSGPMKWTVLTVLSALFAISTLIRLIRGEEADDRLCWVFMSVSGLIFGAKIIEYFKK